MLNILFALFLFGMLLSLCSRILTRASQTGELTINDQELAFLLALALGSYIALHAGAASIYGPNILE